MNLYSDFNLGDQNHADPCKSHFAGYSSNSNSVGIAVSTPIPRRAVRNFKSGSGSQEVRSGVPRNICIEEVCLISVQKFLL